MTEGEKRRWVTKLRAHPEFAELAGHLERQWFPKRRGRRSKVEWSADEIVSKDLDDGVLWLSVLAEKRRLEDSGERPRAPMRAAQLAVAGRHGITVATLQKKLQAFRRRTRNRWVLPFGNSIFISK